jgi:hypothetical protein
MESSTTTASTAAESQTTSYSSQHIVDIAAKVKPIIDTRDRKHGDTVYKQCFIGREFCKWFIVNGVSQVSFFEQMRIYPEADGLTHLNSTHWTERRQ